MILSLSRFPRLLLSIPLSRIYAYSDFGALFTLFLLRAALGRSPLTLHCSFSLASLLSYGPVSRFLPPLAVSVSLPSPHHFLSAAATRSSSAARVGSRALARTRSCGRARSTLATRPALISVDAEPSRARVVSNFSALSNCRARVLRVLFTRVYVFYRCFTVRPRKVAASSTFARRGTRVRISRRHGRSSG